MRSLASCVLAAVASTFAAGCASVIGADFDVTSEVVIDGLAYPKSLLVNDGFLYVTAQGSGDPTGKVIRVPLAGGPPEIFADGLISPEQLFLADGYMYWTGASPPVSRKALAGGDVEVMAKDTIPGIGLEVLGDTGYFSSGDQVRTFTVSKPGQPSKDFAMMLKNPALIVSDGKALYVTEYAMGYGVAKVELKDGAVTHVVMGYDLTAGITIFGDSAYFAGTQGGKGVIGVLNLTNGGSAQIGSAGTTPAALATDGKFAYWASYGDGRIFKVGLGGGNAFEIAKDQVSPNGLTVDDTYVYWAELNANGAVRRRKK